MNLSTTSVDYVNPFHSKNNIFFHGGTCMTKLDRELRRAVIKGKVLSTIKTIAMNPKFLKAVPKILSFFFRQLQKRFL